MYVGLTLWKYVFLHFATFSNTKNHEIRKLKNWKITMKKNDRLGEREIRDEVYQDDEMVEKDE